jgi:hypothetical protein
MRGAELLSERPRRNYEDEGKVALLTLAIGPSIAVAALFALPTPSSN